jgi:hypothetical protein
MNIIHTFPSYFLKCHINIILNRNTSVGITTGYRLDSPVSTPSRDNKLFSHSVQTGSGAHPASSPMGTGGYFRGVKLTAHLNPMPRSRKVELYLHPTLSSWRNA